MSEKLTQAGEYQTIYLAPHCNKCRNALMGYEDGLCWCSDPQEPCEECGKDWVRYEIAEPPK